MQTTEAMSWLRKFAIGRVPPDFDPQTVTAHSLKVTLLSWMAKAGVPKGTRRLLGGHTAPGDRSVVLYSRDALAAPMRLLSDVLVKVRRRDFLPDSTRSGYFPAAADEASSVSESSSSVSTDSAGAPSTAAVAAVPVDGLVLNCRTNVLHVDGADGKLACGKPMPMAPCFLRAFPSSYVSCKRCFDCSDLGEAAP